MHIRAALAVTVLATSCATGCATAVAPDEAETPSLSARLTTGPTFVSRERVELPIAGAARMARVMVRDVWLAVHETPAGNLVLDDAVISVEDPLTADGLGLVLRSVRIVTPITPEDDTVSIEPDPITRDEARVETTLAVTLELDWLLVIDGQILPAGIQSVPNVPLSLDVERMGDDRLRARIQTRAPIDWHYGRELLPSTLALDISALELR